MRLSTEFRKTQTCPEVIGTKQIYAIKSFRTTAQNLTRYEAFNTAYDCSMPAGLGKKL